ncbi:hypothetical protein CVV68_16500 [Arthrobacter livingstonensis]|uniref:HPt domain-containing protein n=1 Tax=Arthrobacter livingstonensis TaxID=670078 RepID=A0A2V5LS71_9MICC|nr:Hpt domain-containing protein [Arthrobacter livingstonensis]PYI65827.1 hypothetical protein CVV68_16500 [Arthrobacter livingstonensis]
MNTSSLPLVSMDSLRELEESLDGQSVLCRGFVHRYVQMWPQRLCRIKVAVNSHQWDEATEAALSLFSSSAMVGAEQLGQLAGDLVELLKQRHFEGASDYLAALALCGDRTAVELEDSYVQSTA